MHDLVLFKSCNFNNNESFPSVNVDSHHPIIYLEPITINFPHTATNKEDSFQEIHLSPVDKNFTYF